MLNVVTMQSEQPLILPRAVLFDMDGTLTEPLLDFARIKQEMGIGPGPILESLAELDEGRQWAALEVLHRHEEQAARESRLSGGCRELLQWLEAKGIATALITRNSLQSVMTVLGTHGLKMDVLVTRDDGPYKPSPHPLATACARLGVGSEEVVMVGDGQYDVESGLAAGIRTIWISHGKARAFAAEPWKTVANLHELLVLLQGVR